ncbi:hypothetical protein [Flavivirga eckloniae]|uniref:Histidine kinase n=1 Tax=Flavivirga eckloniae TaxID=1803846 RepID=A0A2K9PMP9_9FLAO|nr:hypothetical protein [Flavivirga eckloniae]AUP77857.1 hypothetical protein C1H87_03645 [Flavivirga eckloniae]
MYIKFIKKYSLTIVGLILSTTILLFSIINDIDLFERFINQLILMEMYEVDEFIIPIFIFWLFAVFDMRKRQKTYKIEHEKVIIYKAMLSSANHVVNNFLNQMQVFKITAENTPNFDQDVLKLYNKIIKNAAEQIDSLGKIVDIDEKTIFKSVEPKPDLETIHQHPKTGINFGKKI